MTDRTPAEALAEAIEEMDGFVPKRDLLLFVRGERGTAWELITRLNALGFDVTPLKDHAQKA